MSMLIKFFYAVIAIVRTQQCKYGSYRYNDSVPDLSRIKLVNHLKT